ncbi:MAG: ABC transporter ATP-binding protein [Gammaproteobacteria bacterium]|nr:ABC transporter ATP-binding protein [Gammaproteobacteria bacterium]MDH5728454.1 ABC transporter ATP-binding protein [Gammaproteobacteria bacterium]
MTFALDIKQLSKTYRNGFQALRGIDLQVKQGDFFALLGPNGAGKSTTIGIVSSLVRKTAGSVKIFNTDLDADPSNAKEFLGLVPQEFNFNVFEPVIEIVLNQAGFYGISRSQANARTEHLLKQLGLWDKRKEMARNLSGGMKRRLMIARAMVHEPKLLILDEPTAGVDVEIRHSMWKYLRQLNQQGTTIILTTHYLDEAESLCKNIAIIDEGRIIENTSMKALLNQLNCETFVLDIKALNSSLPQLENFELQLIDDTTIEVGIAKQQSINELFVQLSHHGIDVISMRNKVNRLEELFMGLVERNETESLTHTQG